VGVYYLTDWRPSVEFEKVGSRFAPAPGSAAPRDRQRCCGHADKGDEPALTLVEDLDYATEYLLLNTVTSLAVRLECVTLIFMADQLLT
jgi:hypothetical protein